MLIGIDFGTTNTCVSYYSESSDTIEMIIDNCSINNTNKLIPSCVYIEGEHDDTNWIFGSAALNQNGVRFFKTTLEKKYTIAFLNWLKNLAIEQTGKIPTHCSFSVPVDWDFTKRDLLKRYFEEIGLIVVSILLEPVAAALLYKNLKQESKGEEYFVVIDCGGGTTDLSLVNVDSNLDYYQVVYVLGKCNLGGENLTQNLIDYCKSKLDLSVSQKEIYNACELAKHELTYKYESLIYLESQDKQIRISRPQFEMINIDWIKSLTQVITQFKTGISEYLDEITNIVFIGGGSRCYLVKDIFQKVFADPFTIYLDENLLQTAVSNGCLIKGISQMGYNILSQTQFDVTVLTIVPDTIGIEVLDGEFIPIISKNNLLPVKRTMRFTNTDEEQTIDINIYKGDRKYTKDNEYITTLQLTELPKSPKGTILIDITFSMDQNLLFYASAQTNTGQSVECNLINNDDSFKFKSTTQDLYSEFLNKIQDS